MKACADTLLSSLIALISLWMLSEGDRRSPLPLISQSRDHCPEKSKHDHLLTLMEGDQLRDIAESSKGSWRLGSAVFGNISAAMKPMLDCGKCKIGKATGEYHASPGTGSCRTIYNLGVYRALG